MIVRINNDEKLIYCKIDTQNPFRDELERAMQELRGSEYYLEEYTAIATGWVRETPEGTQSFMLNIAREYEGQHPPHRHSELALVYLDRCVILTIEEMTQIRNGQQDPETLLWRLTRNTRMNQN